MNNTFVSALQQETNATITENGALTNKSTLNPVLDLFGCIGALRTRTEAEIIQLFSRAFATDRLLAVKTLFHCRDAREGMGERKTFRVCLKWLAQNYPDLVVKNIENIPFFGRWDDLLSVLDSTSIVGEAYRYIRAQLCKDVVDMNADQPVSLLAKWLPSVNASSPESKALAKRLRKYLDMTPKEYRKTLSALKAYIDVLEVKLCAKKWGEVDYNKVPSKASLLYRKAFGKHDHDRYDAYLKAVEEGKAKMNAGVVYPYDIVRAILFDDTEQGKRALDLQWKSMPNWLEGNEYKAIAVADMSGSMFSSNGGLPAYVALSLSIYFAERNVGPFKDVFISFSTEPAFHTIVGNNLREKIDNMDKNDWSQSTNLQSVFDLLLNTAQKHNVPSSDMPARVLIISDMEFDQADGSNNQTNFQAIRSKYAAAGYAMPGLVFWNVDSRNNGSPIIASDSNVALVSGCSPSILKSVLSGKPLDPVSVMLDTLNAPRYDRVSA